MMLMLNPQLTDHFELWAQLVDATHSLSRNSLRLFKDIPHLEKNSGCCCVFNICF
jgi:hypothetical protein